ncbi:MAG: hypothetical protein IJ757_06975 [Clostridiales bacterium]|nr:hypothetical protein [Clostridiales bacterium]
MRSNYKRIISMATALAICTGLTACGHPKSANKLIRNARREHGPCDVVSQTTDDEGSVVVLSDQLQGFEYQVSSYMSDINIDGASFGSVPSTADSFDWALHAFVLDEIEDEMNDICDDYGLTMGSSNLEDCFWVTADLDRTEDESAEGLVLIAEAMQEYNLENRMDGWTIYLDYEDDTHIGSVRLPDVSFRDEAKEKEDYYLEMAQMKNPDAVFVRSEEGTFADTGVDPLYVSVSYDEYYPQNADDPVMFYFFEADGKEFYICDFLVNDRVNYGEWFSNYDEVFN